MDPRSPVRDVAIMKGAQTCGTVGIGENAIGFWLHHQKTAPCMFMTADEKLSKLRMDEYILPMFEHSDLGHIIQNNSELNTKKAGQTAKKISVMGGGFLMMANARSRGDTRSASIRNAVFDEVDTYPISKDGDTLALGKRRCTAFKKSCKILTISTPTTEEHSLIKTEFDKGDQRVFKVPCLGCGEFDEIRWKWEDREGQQVGGIVWALDEDGDVVPGSVKYACRHCGHCHDNEHKRDMFPRGYWEPTAKPKHPSLRSYHISGLMSPADFYSWEDAVIDWLQAWNVDTNQARDNEKLQEFYNNVLGQPFRIAGSRLTLAKVGRHVRNYVSGVVPNKLAEQMCGGKVGYLTCSADIHKDHIDATVMAWGPNRVGFTVGRSVFRGPTADPFDEASPWGRLSELIEMSFRDDHGTREYPIKITMVDSGWGEMASEVYDFCAQYDYGVYPLKGDTSIRKSGGREFKRISDESKAGVDGWLVNVDHYKNRLAAVLRADPRPENELAMVDSVSFPKDTEDEALKELIAEEYVKVGKRWEWKRVKARNELWDLTVYNSAARDIAAYMVCREQFELDAIWSRFWEWADENEFGWAEVAPVADE
jgi:phage terminase large subunit GpA-like protein